MANSEPFVLDDGTEILIEVSPDIGATRVSTGGESTTRKFKDAFKNLGPFISEIRSSMNLGEHAPQEFTIEFGVKFSAEAGIIITKASTDFNFKVAAKWKNS